MPPAPRLGRGLAALLGDAAPSAATARTTLPVAALEPGPFQPRMSIADASLDELTASIRQQGVLQPILVRPHPERPGLFQIIGGERRWRAAQDAGLHEVPVFVRDLDDRAALAAALVENLQRQDLDPIEEAEGYNRLASEFDLSQEQLGDLVGKSRSHVANMMRLLQLPAPVRQQVRDGALSAGHARALLGHRDAEATARIVIARGLNVRQTEALLAGSARPARPKPEPDAELAALERDLSLRTGLVVTIEHKGQAGTVRIAYRNIDQLESIVDRLGRT